MRFNLCIIYPALLRLEDFFFFKLRIIIALYSVTEVTDSASLTKLLQVGDEWLSHIFDGFYGCDAFQNVTPDPKTSCGPYKPQTHGAQTLRQRPSPDIGRRNHDTIGMVVVDKGGHVMAGTSTNGANHKVHG